MSIPAIDLRACAARLTGNPRTLVPGGLAIAIIVISFYLDVLWPWADKLPKKSVLPFTNWVGGAMDWLVKEADLGLFTFQEFTRGVAWLFSWPLKFLNWSLWKGYPVTEIHIMPSFSWIGISAVLVLVGWRVGGWKLALLNATCCGYLIFFGQWQSTMMTLSSIGIAVPIGCGVGLYLGIWAHRKPHFEKILTPALDFMQTIPVFAYLLPILFLFGFSPVSAMIATIIYAMPPMVRATMLGLKLVSPEIIEFGNMTGCSPRQLMWRVMIPAARPTLMVGVNQVIMLSLNAVIIASLIGAGGLGFDVLQALRSLKIGAGLEAGMAIVLLAVMLDRTSQTFAAKPPPEHQEAQAAKSLIRRNPYLIVAILFLLGTLFASYGLPWLKELPDGATITTAPFWDQAIRWVSINIFDTIEAIKGFLWFYVMLPFKKFLLDLPWTVVVALVALLGWRLGGWRLALTVGLLAGFLALSGFWEKAMISIYLIGISVIISALIGLPLGIWAAHSERVSRAMRVFVDTLQTLPSFVYLMPVVMLFQVGDFPAMIAVILYAIAPAIRYTDHGLRKVPPSLVEAAKAAGCNNWQMLWKVKIPLAFPEILLGLNQTIMLAMSMLVITALVGTRDLGQEVYIGLSRADTGRGLVAGFCVAFIAIIADRLIQAYALQRKEKLGID